jgi:hypothetical protein
MEGVILTNNGILTNKFNDNLNVMETLPISESLSYYYNDYVNVSDDLTFGGLFSILEPYIDVLEEHFMADTLKWPLKPYFDLIKEDIDEDLKFKEIQFSWNYQYFEYDDRRTGKKEKSLEEYVHLNAIGESDEYGICNYSLSFVSLNNIKDVPVKILKDCKIYGMDRETLLLEFDKEIKLKDLISSLLHEITFYGSPERNKEQLEILTERLDHQYDESELVSWKDMELEFLNDELNEALSEENYEWAERVRLEIEKIKKESE